MIKECAEPDCGSPAHTRSLCRRHYQTKRNRGELDINAHESKWCTEPRCAQPHYARALCRRHYQAKRKNDPGWITPRTKTPVSLRCEVRGCGLPAATGNLCQRHYSRWNTYPELRSLEALALFDEERLCPLCMMKSAAVVDHDHVTGRVRGHLCYGCNTALGKVHDDPAILRRMIDYIEQAKARTP